MKKLMCNFTFTHLINPLELKRLVYRESPSLNDKAGQHDYAKAEADKAVLQIHQEGGRLEGELAQISQDNDKLAQTDIVELALKTKDHIDKYLGRVKLTLDNSIMGQKDLLPYREQIASARSNVFKQIDSVTEIVNAKKETIVSAFQKIDEGKDLFKHSNTIISKRRDDINKIADLEHPSMEQIREAENKVKDIDEDLKLNQKAANRVADIANELRDPPYDTLALAQKEAPNMSEMYKSMFDNIQSSKNQLSGANKLVQAFILESKANKTGDGKLFDEAKKAQQEGKNRAKIQNVDLSTQEEEPTI